MINYSVPRTVIDSSREELIEIFRWIRAHERDESGPVTVLIGGWAVYSYNPPYMDQWISIWSPTAGPGRI
jgi:hypothetical protein